MTESDLQEFQSAVNEQREIQAEILNIRTMKTDKNIEYALRNLADDNKRYSEDIVSLRDQLYNVQKDKEEERLLLKQKLSSLEEQYSSL